MRAKMEQSTVAHHHVLYRDPFSYCAHPHLIAAASDNWLLVFTHSVRRNIVLHPPQDPFYCNMMMRSCDEGQSWSVPSIVPAYRWHGVECAGLTKLSSGTILLNQWVFDWHTLAFAEANLDPSDYKRSDELMSVDAMASELADWTPDPGSIATKYPWARGSGETWIHRSIDAGLTFTKTTRIDTSPYSGGYGMRGAIELGNGEITLPLSDVPHYRNIFVVRSNDSGESWSAAQHVAGGEGHEFEEPAPLLLRSGHIIMMLRDNVTRILHCVRSLDGGQSWSAPAPTGIMDYPAHLLELPDGGIACVTGRRTTPFGIMLYFSEDGGKSWSFNRPIIVRTGLPSRDLGYPTMARREDGSLFVAYYAQDSDGITGLHASIFEPHLLARADQGKLHGGN